MKLIHFMASTAGRMLRFVVGALLILGGLAWVGGTAGTVMAVIGLIPLLAATFDLCLAAPLFKMPLSGRRIRALEAH
ncbi:MAG TPA: DUF2892 domain-containing protein [Polyangiaceae bacterium]|nr:DUF2892 domain-containing protein [Polyangiaceae bacterium]